jgi:hypothetical protein
VTIPSPRSARRSAAAILDEEHPHEAPSSTLKMVGR